MNQIIRTKLEIAITALNFYGDFKNNYLDGRPYEFKKGKSEGYDTGDIARKALAEMGEGKQ